MSTSFSSSNQSHQRRRNGSDHGREKGKSSEKKQETPAVILIPPGRCSLSDDEGTKLSRLRSFKRSGSRRRRSLGSYENEGISGSDDETLFLPTSPAQLMAPPARRRSQRPPHNIGSSDAAAPFMSSPAAVVPQQEQPLPPKKAELASTTDTSPSPAQPKKKLFCFRKHPRNKKQQHVPPAVSLASPPGASKDADGAAPYSLSSPTSVIPTPAGSAASPPLVFPNFPPLSAYTSRGDTIPAGKSPRSPNRDGSKSGHDGGDDPVVKLFEQRTTQRVRFALQQDYGSTHHIVPSRPPAPTPTNPAAPGTNNASSTVSSSPSSSPGRKGRKTKISRFLTGALFGASNREVVEEVEADVQREAMESAELGHEELVWTSALTGDTEATLGGEMIRTLQGNRTPFSSSLTTTFVEDNSARAHVIKLWNKARRAEYVHFRYGYSLQCYVKALERLREADYPEDHPFVVQTRDALHHAHYVSQAYKNSALIVKLGIRHEDAGELVRALKMYTVAYRMRVELSSSQQRQHPSLVVLLNMLGNIQIKRGELHEAMQIYQLALRDDSNAGKSRKKGSRTERSAVASETSSSSSTTTNMDPRSLMARSVTYREMGIIYEKWGDANTALMMYHESLDCLAALKSRQVTASTASSASKTATFVTEDVVSGDSVTGTDTATATGLTSPLDFASITVNATGGDDGMEILMGRQPSQRRRKAAASQAQEKMKASQKDSQRRTLVPASSDYDLFFPPELDDLMRQQREDQKFLKDKDKKKNAATQVQQQRLGGNYADLDAALTLHQIGQLHRSAGEYNLALVAFTVALRGMKYCVRQKNHPNVAAILGNIGNLQKEMGDLDASFATYQQVLGMESYRLGLSHPDVAVTLHNIATIDAARGNHDHSLALYRQVLNLQRKLMGPNHVAVAVTSACMGDVYERVGHLTESIGCYEEAVRIQTLAAGRHSLTVARLLHKLGKLALAQGEYHVADGHVARALLIYRLHKLDQQGENSSDDQPHEWVVDALRDGADIDAGIAMEFDIAARTAADTSVATGGRHASCSGSFDYND